MLLHKNIKFLEIHSDHCIAASGYWLIKWVNGEQFVFSRLLDKKYTLFSAFRLLGRFFRAEIHYYLTLSNNKGICIAKKGIFLEDCSNNKFDKVLNIERGSRPLSICEDNDGVIYFGEYFSNNQRDSVNVYASFDAGYNWEIVYSFPNNTIRHIHSIQVDPYTGNIWIATGDEDGECIIAFTRDKFNTIEIVKKGGQDYRTCRFIFLKDEVIYGTDSPYMNNYICSINRSDNSINKLIQVQGSVINACQIGDQCFISTTVEPSKVNKDKYSYLWASADSKKWEQVASFKKDPFNMTLFQFGNIRFPQYRTFEAKSLFIYGSALKGIDGHSIEFELPLVIR